MSTPSLRIEDALITAQQAYSGELVRIPYRTVTASSDGPTVLVTGAVHGDEVNGAGIVRSLIIDPPFELIAGRLIFVPVVNVLGFERHARYLPDRRDLNRSFPGSPTGSIAARFAHAVFESLVPQSDFVLDFHTAAARRTNFPNVRADMDSPEVASLARAFGTNLIVHGEGPEGSFRRAACDAGTPAIILEAGEIWKFEPAVVETGRRGVRNTLIALGMVDADPELPIYQAEVRKTSWVRSDTAGMVAFAVGPGDVVRKGDRICTVGDWSGAELEAIDAPADAVVLGIATHPAVSPGSPICHLGYPEGGVAPIERARNTSDGGSLDSRLREDLATNIEIDSEQASN